MARILPLCYNCHMRVLSVNAIREFTRLSGNKYSIQTPQQPLPKMKEAFCAVGKECAYYYYGFPEEYFGKQVMNIELLRSTGKGTGTRAVKNVVRKSLADPETQGRVTLAAAQIDNKMPHPFLFYYKLGFRSCEDFYNKFGEEGLTIPNTDIMTYMYLPKENIKHCLNYKNVADEQTSGLKYIYDRMELL